MLLREKDDILPVEVEKRKINFEYQTPARRQRLFECVHHKE